MAVLKTRKLAVVFQDFKTLLQGSILLTLILTFFCDLEIKLEDHYIFKEPKTNHSCRSLRKFNLKAKMRRSKVEMKT